MHTFLKFPKLFVVLLVLCLFPKTDQFSVSKQLNRSNSSKAKNTKSANISGKFIIIANENSWKLWRNYNSISKVLRKKIARTKDLLEVTSN